MTGHFWGLWEQGYVSVGKAESLCVIQRTVSDRKPPLWPPELVKLIFTYAQVCTPWVLPPFGPAHGHDSCPLSVGDSLVTTEQSPPSLTQGCPALPPSSLCSPHAVCFWPNPIPINPCHAPVGHPIGNNHHRLLTLCLKKAHVPTLLVGAFPCQGIKLQ